MVRILDPLRRSHPSNVEPRALLVSDERVGCPNSRGGVCLDACLSCRLLDEVVVDDRGRSWVVCHPSRERLVIG